MLVPLKVQLTADLFFLSLSLCTYLCASVILQGQISHCDDIQPTTKATRCENPLYILLHMARSWYIRQKKQVGYELV